MARAAVADDGEDAVAGEAERGTRMAPRWGSGSNWCAGAALNPSSSASLRSFRRPCRRHTSSGPACRRSPRGCGAGARVAPGDAATGRPATWRHARTGVPRRVEGDVRGARPRACAPRPAAGRAGVEEPADERFAARHARPHRARAAPGPRRTATRTSTQVGVVAGHVDHRAHAVEQTEPSAAGTAGASGKRYSKAHVDSFVHDGAEEVVCPWARRGRTRKPASRPASPGNPVKRPSYPKGKKLFTTTNRRPQQRLPICRQRSGYRSLQATSGRMKKPSGPALPLRRLGGLQARGPARARAARVRDAAGGGLRAGQAARHGLRDHHRPRHDRRRAGDRRSGRRVHLRGAHRALSRRAAGRARALPRHHARRPRVAAGPRRRRRGGRRLPAQARDHVRARAPLLRRRGAADRPPPAPARRAVPDLGGPQRRPRPRAQPARRRSTSTPRRHGDRRLGRPRGGRHRAHLVRDAGGRDAGGVPRARPRRARRRVRRPGLGGQVGARGDGARRARRSAATTMARRPTRPRCCG